MYIPFKNLPNEARVWIYQANRAIKTSEQELVSAYLKNATDQWAAHGAALKASFKIIQNRFVVLAVDESYNAVSGCSIDTSTHWLKMVGEKLSMDFFDRSVVYLNTANELTAISPFVVKSYIEKGVILSQTPIFTQQIADIKALKSWPVPAIEIIQYKRFFKNQNVDV